MALINKLNAIGDAIREKTGKSDLLTLEQMPVEIAAIETGGGDIEPIVLTGTCTYACANPAWNGFLPTVTTNKMKDASYLFYSNNEVEEIPFDLDFDNSTYYDMTSMFNGCTKLKRIKGKMINPYPSGLQYWFRGCQNLRELPEVINLTTTRIHNYAYANAGGYAFQDCYSLRSVPEELVKELYNPLASYNSYSVFCSGFKNCFALDEVRGLNPQMDKAFTSNLFSDPFYRCYRVKDIIFLTQEDGTPYTAQWKSQTIDLYSSVGNSVGYGGVVFNNGVPSTSSDVLRYNSGITPDKVVYDDATYQALKNDPDWTAANAAYSRYNHDSAVRTINSLPDTSAYLATAGGTNTIKFVGNAGSATDGGAINTLTEEEIAVAAAKGWTVTFI